jgi:hypothetical protein
VRPGRRDPHPRLVPRADAGLGGTGTTASRSPDHAPRGLAWARGLSGHAERLGLLLAVAPAPPAAAAFYARVTHLSATCMTSQMTRPWPRAVITSRPRA